MNQKQFKLMWVMIIVFVLIAFCPPIYRVTWAFEFARNATFGTVNWIMWGSEFLVWGAMFIGLWITFSDKRQRKPPLPPGSARWWNM